MLGVILMWLSACTQQRVVLQTGALSASGSWNDEIYTSVQDLPTPQFLTVEVNLSQGQMVAVRLQQHPAWKAPGEQELLLRRVLERQTTAVDELREEESAQDVLLRAIETIEDTLDKAQREAPLKP
jgi:uncharacterized protein with FMN-binding domain